MVWEWGLLADWMLSPKNGTDRFHPVLQGRARYESGSPDPENGILGDHIQSLNEPVYAAHPPEIGIDELPDTMPSVYA